MRSIGLGILNDCQTPGSDWVTQSLTTPSEPRENSAKKLVICTGMVEEMNLMDLLGSLGNLRVGHVRILAKATPGDRLPRSVNTQVQLRARLGHRMGLWVEVSAVLRGSTSAIARCHDA